MASQKLEGYGMRNKGKVGGFMPPATWRKEAELEKLALEKSKLSYFLDSVLKGKGKPEKDSPLPFEDAFVAAILPEFKRKFEEHFDYLVESGTLDNTLAILYNPDLEPEEIDRHYAALVAILASPFAMSWAMQHTSEVEELVTGMYGVATEMAHETAGLTLPAGFAYNARDLAAIDQFTNTGIIWISEGAHRQVVTSSVHTLTAYALENNLNRAEFAQLLKNELGYLVPARADSYYQNLASLVMNRTRNTARMFDYARLNIQYVVVMTVGDDRVCGRCEIHDGEVYAVEDVVSTMERGLEASTPEELIDALPFVNSVTADGFFVLSNGTRVASSSDADVLARAGITLPLHPSCRCFYLIYS